MIIKPKSHVAVSHSLTSSRVNHLQTMRSTRTPIAPARCHLRPWTLAVKLGTGSSEAMPDLAMRRTSEDRCPSASYSWMSSASFVE